MATLGLGLVLLYLFFAALGLLMAWVYAFVIGWGFTAGSIYARNRYRRREGFEPVDLSAYDDVTPLG